MAAVNSYFSISGMTCGACSSSITEQLNKIDGVSSVSVSLITEEAKVMHDSSVPSSTLIESIESCGFDAKLIRTEANSTSDSSSSAASFSSSSLPSSASSTSLVTTSKFNIGGMTCGACSASITEAIEKLAGVELVSVSLITEEGLVKHSPSLSSDEIAEAIEDCGFEAKLISTSSRSSNVSTKIAVQGMTCGACSASITEALELKAHVIKASVSLVTEEAMIIHEQELTTDEIIQTIEDCGFDATLIASSVVTSSPSNSDVVRDEEVSLQIFGVTDQSDLIGLQYNIEARLNGFVGIKNFKIRFNVSINSEAAILLTEALSPSTSNSAPAAHLIPDHHNTEFDNIIDELFIVYSPTLIGIRDIVDELNSIDEQYLFVTINSVDQASTSQLKLLSRVKDIEFWRSNFYKSIMFGLPVIIMSYTQGWTFWSNLKILPGLYLVSLLQFVLASHVQFNLGKTFIKKFILFVKNGFKNATMDVLVCISTSISFSFSVFSIILSVWYGQSEKPPKLLFETSCMLITFISMGKWLENKAKGATSSALSRLLSLTPTNCTIIEDLGKYNQLLKESDDRNSISDLPTRSIGIDLIQTGDIAVILPGGKIPADGKIVLGETEIDESFLTGESLPVFKSIGDDVIGGSVNGAGLIHIEVIHTGKNSQLQQIINLVKDSQINNAPIQGFADYVASRFVPSVLILATITFSVWTMLCFYLHSDKLPGVFSKEENGKFFVCLKLAISVVVVACPCALGLAAPTAMMVGTGVGASHGVLIKGGDVLEKASGINIILFDKTGTLTTGGMTLTNYKNASDSINEDVWWNLIGSVENNSEHPIGKALVREAKLKLGLSFEDDSFGSSIQNFKVMSGLGLKCSVTLADGKSYDVCIGNERMMMQEFKENKFSFNKEDIKTPQSTDTFAFIIIDSLYSGYVSLSDKIKPHAREVINYLQYDQNYIVGMVTGDNKYAAKKIGKEVGIPECNIFSEVSPINKDKVILELKERFGGDTNVSIGFVGDGINDAPALAQADVGMAISSGSDIAIESADIVLIGGNSSKQSDLHGVSVALSISKATFKRIKINFLWAAVYNMIMLPFAMGCFLSFNLMLPPIAAAGSMALSSVSVVISSLYLKKWKPPVIAYGLTAKEEDVGAPFSLKTSTLQEFNRIKNQHKFWQVLKRRPSEEPHGYQML